MVSVFTLQHLIIYLLIYQKIASLLQKKSCKSGSPTFWGENVSQGLPYFRIHGRNGHEVIAKTEHVIFKVWIPFLFSFSLPSFLFSLSCFRFSSFFLSSVLVFRHIPFSSYSWPQPLLFLLKLPSRISSCLRIYPETFFFSSSYHLLPLSSFPLSLFISFLFIIFLHKALSH